MTPRQTLKKLVNACSGDSSRNIRWSRFYATPAFPKGSGPDFVNAACVVKSAGDPQAVLDTLHRVESRFGRVRKKRWGPRILDLDLIGCEGLVLPDLATFNRWKDLDLTAQQRDSPDQLILPHPRVQDRSFVLRPLADVAPDWRHPVLGLTVREMLAARPVDEQASVVPL